MSTISNLPFHNTLNISPLKASKQKNEICEGTNAISTMCVAAYIGTVFTENQWAWQGSLNLSKIANGEIWRLVTFPFLHVNIFHLALNMSALASVGPSFEEKWGIDGLAKITALATTANVLAQALFGSYNSYLLGFSGVLYGMEGALVASRVKAAKKGKEAEVYQEAIYNLGIQTALSIALEQMNFMNISHLSHASGFIVGYIFGLYTKQKK